MVKGRARPAGYWGAVMTFSEAIQSALVRKYASFQGRALRSEFCWFMLAHFTPTSASWLNAVEGLFAALTKRRLKRGLSPTYKPRSTASSKSGT
jgi:transposase